MTDQVRDDQLDRQIRDFLAWQAEDLGDAPNATEMTMRITSRAGTRTISSRSAPLLGWALLAALLIVALLGALVIGAMSQRQDAGRLSYEAVVLRLDQVVGSTDVLIVGVNAEGREHQIARLQGTPSVDSIGKGFVRPTGAVSSSGLLAISSQLDDGMTHWEIFDLHRPQARPIVVDGIRQDSEQIQGTPYFRLDMRPSVFWGPGEHLAIPWYERLDTNNWHLSFVDGRSGAATSVDYPDDLVELLPRWASDGSGVFVGDSASRSRLGTRRVLRPDGTIVDAGAAVPVDSCRTEYRSGAAISVADGRIIRRDPDGSSEVLRTPSGVGFACLAPDESAIAHSIEISDGAGGITPTQRTGLITASGRPIEVEGSFAGWLEVEP